MNLVVAYMFFALVATVANIASQEVAILKYDGPFSIQVSIFFGTGVGLLVKYFLDKKYIFRFQTHSTKHGVKVLILYVSMGLLTTAIFWGVEFGFHVFFASREMRYLGGVIGLSIGYAAKYYLDKHYVFRKENP